MADFAPVGPLARADGFTVSGLQVSAYTLPTEVPEADGTLAWEKTTVVVVEAELAGGARGLGFAYGHPAMAGVIKETLIPKVVGLDVRDSMASWTSMVRAIRNLGRPGLSSMAISAVDLALWDAKARAFAQPLHKVLGGIRDAVPIYGSGGFTTYSMPELVKQLCGWVEAGIPRVKMKIGTDWGRSWHADLARIKAVRDAIGDDAELFVDANGAYSRVQARRLGLQFAADFGVSWFEEPVSSDDLVGLQGLVQALPLDVAAGEYGYDLDYFAAMLDAGAVDVLQADVGRCGGITEWLRVAALAAAAHVPFSGHCGPAIHLHAATVPPNLRHLEYFHDHVRIESMLFDGVIRPKDGSLSPSEAPGNGYALKQTDATGYRVA
jgi:L-alanine-DL-glutamate epimerase-like enolase superfamily enzyme